MDQFNNHPLYRRHNIDSALSSLWDFYKKNFTALFIISLVMSFITQFASSMVNMSDLSATSDPALLLEKMKEFVVPILIISLVSLLSTTILHYYIIFNPVNKENTVLLSFIRSLKYFLPYLIVIVLLAFAGTVAIFIGVFVFIIGAFFAMLYVATIFCFILPAMMAEDLNIGSTVARTMKLAHKNFWSNIGWVSVFIIIMVVISLVLSGIILLPFTGSFIKTIINPAETAKMTEIAKKPLFIILSAVVGGITLPVMPIFACILYFNGKAGEDEKQKVSFTEPDNKVRVEDLYAKPYSDEHPDNPDNKS